MRPALKPGLLPVWRDRDTLQIGIDSRRAVALSGMAGLASMIGLLDGSRDRAQVIRAAVNQGIPADVAERVLALLAAGGALDDFPAATLRMLSQPLRARLAAELATVSLANGDGDGGARTLARRLAAQVRICGGGRVGDGIAGLLAAAGVGRVQSDDQNEDRHERRNEERQDYARPAPQDTGQPAPQRSRSRRDEPQRTDPAGTGPTNPGLERRGPTRTAAAATGGQRPGPTRTGPGSTGSRRSGLTRTAPGSTGSQRTGPGPGGTAPQRAGPETAAPQRAAPQRAGPELPDLAILVGHHSLETRAELMGNQVPHLAASAGEAIGIVGPLVVPGRTACLTCLDLTRTDRDPAWPLILAQLIARKPDPLACDAPLAAAVAAQAAAQALAFIDRAAAAGAVTDGTLELVLPGWQWRRRTWPRHSDCSCGCYTFW